MAGQVIKEVPGVTTETKPGLYTTEFWFTVVGFLVGVLQMAVGMFQIHDDLVLKIMGLLVAAYAASRGLAKNGVTFTPPETTTQARRQA